MKKLIVVLFAAVLVLTSCTGLRKEMIGDNNVLGRTFEMENALIYSVEIKDIEFQNFNCKLIFDEALPDSMVISTDENIFLSLDVEVDNNNKKITVKGDPTVRYKPTSFEITVGGLVNDIDIAGGYNVDIKFDAVKQSKINAAGAVDGTVSYADTSEAAINVSGAVDLKLTGNAANFAADISGAATIKGFEFAADTADIMIAGAAEIEITVNESLNADMSGASYIRYKGDGKIMKSDISGLGEIIKVD